MSRPQRRPRRRAKALALLALATSIAISGVVVLLAAGLWSSPREPGAVGFDWPNAGRVYVAQLTQQSTTPAMPARPFTVAASHGIKRIRVFVGDDLVIRAWQRDPVTTFARIQQLLDDAAAAHIKIIFSNYLTQETVAALAGHLYSSWAAAQQDLTTPGSAGCFRARRSLSVRESAAAAASPAPRSGGGATVAEVGSSWRAGGVSSNGAGSSAKGPLAAGQ